MLVVVGVRSLAHVSFTEYCFDVRVGVSATTTLVGNKGGNRS